MSKLNRDGKKAPNTKALVARLKAEKGPARPAAIQAVKIEFASHPASPMTARQKARSTAMRSAVRAALGR